MKKKLFARRRAMVIWCKWEREANRQCYFDGSLWFIGGYWAAANACCIVGERKYIADCPPRTARWVRRLNRLYRSLAKLGHCPDPLWLSHVKERK